VGKVKDAARDMKDKMSDSARTRKPKRAA
jgi:hypothetical protein